MKTKFQSTIETITAAAIPMHMPGHKRRGAAVDKTLPWEMDLTEIYGFDDLHEPEGTLKEVEDRAARLYKTRKSWML